MSLVWPYCWACRSCSRDHPTTNPTSTAIFKALDFLKTRTLSSFAFPTHPPKNHYMRLKSSMMQRLKQELLKIRNGLRNHLLEATRCPYEPRRSCDYPATGGNAMVKAAYSCGRPALGVCAGNVLPMKSANIRQAAHDNVMSKSFDTVWFVRLNKGHHR